MKVCVIPVPCLDGGSATVLCQVKAHVGLGFWRRFRGIHGASDGQLWLPKVRAVHGWTLTESLWLVWLNEADQVVHCGWLHPRQVCWAPIGAAGVIEVSINACRRMLCDE